ncbi:hypothetical protein B0T22DRAFT_71418 [Podospora appendiculata]|uniref:Uncharacterized protein n=1 Tax=Podospora appendiculata TaxID=314037 RepID=A0AAE0XJ74_9PEZI|nr:hypothetical protein B0T22DRAFT_71418 [Podospora appendiculata]
MLGWRVEGITRRGAREASKWSLSDSQTGWWSGMGGLWSCFLRRSARCALLLVIVSSVGWLRAEEPLGFSACLWAGRVEVGGFQCFGRLAGEGGMSIREEWKACLSLRRWRAAWRGCTYLMYARDLGVVSQEGPVVSFPVFVPHFRFMYFPLRWVPSVEFATAWLDRNGVTAWRQWLELCF